MVPLFTTMGILALMRDFVCPLILCVCIWKLFCIKFEAMVRAEFGDDEETVESYLSVIHSARLGPRYYRTKKPPVA